MAGDFDYGSLWENARDVLDLLASLRIAMLQLVELRGPWAVPGFPPALRIGKRPKPPDHTERYSKVLAAIRKASTALRTLLAEERFDLPLHDVWPPSAPRELTGKFSHALRIAPNKYAEIGTCNGQQFESIKTNLFSAQCEVYAVVAELERRPDLAERAYQRKRNKLQRRPAVASHQDATPAIQATVATAPHEATTLRDSGRIEKPRSRAWCHDTPPGKDSVFIRGPIAGKLKEVEAALDMRWPTIQRKQGTTFYVVDVKRGKYAVYFQHQEQLAEASKRLEEFRTRTNAQQQTVTRKTPKKKKPK